MEAYGWNVIVVGAWNVSILTPGGISKRIFNIPEDTPVEVEISIDRPGPFRVRYESVVVTPSPQNLDFSIDECEVGLLQKASQMAVRAINSLPETPFSAVGVNFRFKLNSDSDRLNKLLESLLDDCLGDGGNVVVGSLCRRSLKFDTGVVNVEIARQDNGEANAVFNFHMGSEKPSSLVEWLGKSQDFFDKTNSLLELLELS